MAAQGSSWHLMAAYSRTMFINILANISGYDVRRPAQRTSIHKPFYKAPGLCCMLFVYVLYSI